MGDRKIMEQELIFDDNDQSNIDRDDNSRTELNSRHEKRFYNNNNYNFNKNLNT